jgi:four helix bundle protein
MEKIKSFTELNAWKEGHQLVLMVYELTRKFPREELFCLTSQLRRCVVSVTSNIAEGFNRSSLKEKIQFYSISTRSVSELQSQILIAKDLEYINKAEFTQTADQSVTVHKLCNGLIKSLKEKQTN